MYLIDNNAFMFEKKFMWKFIMHYMDIASKSKEALPINIFLFKVSNRITRKWCDLCLELTKNTVEQWRRSALG